MEIVRLASDELFVRERSDRARFNQDDSIRILHFVLRKLNIALRALATNLGCSLCWAGR
jgi:hypothetical protein